MEKNPIEYRIREYQARLGKYQGKTVLQAHPTSRERISFERFAQEVAHNTTFSAREASAIIELAFDVAKNFVENGNAVEIGPFGTLRPTFRAIQVPKGEAEFDAKKHISHPRVTFSPSRKYFTLEGVSFRRVEEQDIKPKNPAGTSPGGGI